MISDDLLALRLRDQIAEEVLQTGVLNTAMHVTVCRSNGEILQRAAGVKVDLARREYARLLCSRLNTRGLREGGAWVVAWTKPTSLIDATPTELLLLWKDPDGDVPFTVRFDQPFWMLVEWGPDAPLNHAAEAFRRFREREKLLDIRPEDKFRAAQGECAIDPVTGRPVDMDAVHLDPLAAVD